MYVFPNRPTLSKEKIVNFTKQFTQDLDEILEKEK